MMIFLAPIVMKGRHCNGHTLIAKGYRYLSRKTLFLVTTDRAGLTIPGQPYEMKVTDDYRNVGKFNLIFFIESI